MCGTIGVLAMTIGIAHACKYPPAVDLSWCKNNWGFNEGAQCAAQALGLPQASTPNQILGNLLKRPPLMDAAIVAAKAGQHDQAVNAAICCQAHNGAATACLQNNRGVVLNWLLSQ